MDWNQWLTKIDPSTLGLTALVWVGFIALLAFLKSGFWPWFTKEYFPAQIRFREQREANDLSFRREELNIQTSIRDALAKLEVIASHQTIYLEKYEGEISKLTARQESFVVELERSRLETVKDVRVLMSEEKVLNAASA